MSVKRILAGILVVVASAMPVVWKTPSASAQTDLSPFVGRWDFTSVGDDPGSGRASVDNDGNITGNGSTRFAGPITITGTVTPDGSFAFTGSPTGKGDSSRSS
jgi:hypothetical protein